MVNYTHRKHVTLRQVVRLFAVLFVGTIALSSCGLYETIFKTDPKPPPILKEMEKWPHEYYWLVETGVSSRAMGIRSPGGSLSDSLTRVDELLSMVKAQWHAIGPLDTPDKLMTYFRTHHLSAVAEAIDKTLSANQGQEPTGEFHEHLEARAIKRGLMIAYREVKGESR